MALASGIRIGPYEVTARIGVGGMGEVYRATDTNLKRQVAIKVLPAAVAGDAERLVRFQREAEVLAALNHPNIAQIHGLEKSGGTIALVMELVEGPTLADRIAQGVIPVDEALPIAKQIAEALEAAHEQSIIHRDLKPANIKVRSDGTVKVLDFGLAKAMESPSAMSPSVSQAPTITTPAMMTGVGMILGTAAYMAPEQARGKVVDKRADIWAFGAVLFEILTGKRAFPGEDMTDTLAAVVRSEPDWTLLPPGLSPALVTYLKRCLHKDPKQRIPDIATMRLALEGAFETASSPAAVSTNGNAPVAAQSVSWRRAVGVPAAALVLGLVVAGTGAWLAMRPAPTRVVRTTISETPTTALTINGSDLDLAITADGDRIVYTGNTGRDLFVRALDTLEPTRLFAGTPRGPFVSPDSQWVGFVDNASTLKKVAITGGPAATIATEDGNSRGAVWLQGDVVVFASTSPTTGLQRVSAGGGDVTVLTRPDRAKGEADHLWPEALPGAEAVLFTIVTASGGPEASDIAVLDLVTGKETVVLRGGSHAHYVAPSPGSRQSGYLVYAASGTLRAVAFDLATRTTRGTSVAVVPEVVTTVATAPGGVDAAVSTDGTLVYARGSSAPANSRTLAWIDRQGRESALTAPPRPYIYARVSPDGGRIVTYVPDQDAELWVWDIARATLTRLTFAPNQDLHPIWASDSRRVFFSSERDGQRNLYTQAADGTGAADRLTTSANQQNATGLTPDGTRLLFYENSAQTSGDILQVEVPGTHTVTPLLQTPATERNGIVSPDGRWLAYEADDTGVLEVYVRPYPDVGRGRWQVSTSGGTRPLWAPNGRELFYVSSTNALMRVGVEPSVSWTATTPKMLLKEGTVLIPGGNLGRTYDIAPDGQRFVVIKEPSGPEVAPPQLVVVQGFHELLKRLVPAN